MKDDGSDVGMRAVISFDEAEVDPKLIKASNVEEISLLSYRLRCVFS